MAEKTRNGNKWTEARFNNFIKGLLRRGTMKWGPIHEARKEARVDRGIYRCSECDQDVPASIVENRRRVNNIHVDHVNPVIDPDSGFTSWDDCIERMFVELDQLQVLCTSCHKNKTDIEKEKAKQRRANEKRI